MLWAVLEALKTLSWSVTITLLLLLLLMQATHTETVFVMTVQFLFYHLLALGYQVLAVLIKAAGKHETIKVIHHPQQQV
jgi:hypothetical protein